jgi:hypothetical protein
MYRDPDWYSSLIRAAKVLKPACAVPGTWTKSELNESLARTLARLHAASVSAGGPIQGEEDQEEEEDTSCPLSAPAFAYCFPLLRAAMLRHLDSTEVLSQGFDIIAEHTGLRGTDEAGTEEEEVDLFHPRLLPRAALLTLLLRLTAETEGVMQQRAVSCLIDTAGAAGGGPGAAAAGPEEVTALLSALQAEGDSVRDAALRGLGAMVGVLGPARQGEQVAAVTVRRVWVARCDPSPENRELAAALWEEAGLVVGPGLCLEVLEDVAHPREVVRAAAAEALAALLAQDRSPAGAVLASLLERYKEKLELSPAIMDENGRVVQVIYAVLHAQLFSDSIILHFSRLHCPLSTLLWSRNRSTSGSHGRVLPWPWPGSAPTTTRRWSHRWSS